MNTQTIQQEALTRAVTGQKLTNYAAIFDGFADKGIAMDDIKPRENIFTFNAWKALGRTVRKGEHGVKVVTVIECTKKLGEGIELPVTKPRTTTVFHISQTDPLN
jgi:hypothetical protein